MANRNTEGPPPDVLLLNLVEESPERKQELVKAAKELEEIYAIALLEMGSDEELKKADNELQELLPKDSSPIMLARQADIKDASARVLRQLATLGVDKIDLETEALGNTLTESDTFARFEIKQQNANPDGPTSVLPLKIGPAKINEEFSLQEKTDQINAAISELKIFIKQHDI